MPVKTVQSIGVAALTLLTLACLVWLPAATPTKDASAPGAEDEADPRGIAFRSMARPPMPPGALMRAREHRAEMLDYREALSARAGAAPLGGIVSSSWKLLGPTATAGRLRSILIHPVLDNAMLVGAATGGVWRTLDDGHHWVPSDDFMASLTIGCMTMDPGLPTDVYAGTGEGFWLSSPGSSNSAAIPGDGIFKSINFGVTWFQLASTANNPNFQFVNRLAAKRTTGDDLFLLAATGTGIFRSTDGGNTWTQVHVGMSFDVKFHPFNAMLVVASEADGTALYSSDGGQTWQAAAGGPEGERIELAWSRSGGGKVYAASFIQDDPTGLIVFMSVDFGASYVRMTLPCVPPKDVPNCYDPFGDYAMTLWVDPLDDTRLLLGSTYLYKSTNSGATFTNVEDGHGDHHVLIEHPHYGGGGVDNKTVFNGNDGGIYKYDDPFAAAPTITDLNDSLVTTQFYGADIHGSGAIVGGTQDNGTWVYDPQAQLWSMARGADGAFAAIEPGDPDVMYYQMQGLQVFRSDDGGATDVQIFDPDANGEGGANFVAPLERGTISNVNRLYLGGKRLWRSTNPTGFFLNWTAIKGPIPNCPTPALPYEPFSHTLPPPQCNISAISVSPLDPARIWVGYNNGQVWVTTDGQADTPTWIRSDGPGMPARWCSDIVADPHNANRAYVSFLGYSNDSVWKTDDGGLTWTIISGAGPTALPQLPVSGLAVQPLLPGWLYAATDLGLYESQDDGATWSTDNVGPSNVAVEELVFRDVKSMMAVTHGRGLWIVDTFADCNGNMIPDKTDIISGTSTDTDFNAVPDECDSGLPPGKIDPTTGPIVLAKDGGDVLIRCAASCSRGATGYGVYQGTIGSWYSHAPVAGLCQATCPGEIRLTPSSASSYYLVVPNRPGVEGSYGTAVDAARVPSDRPRAPVATQRCTPFQMITSCP